MKSLNNKVTTVQVHDELTRQFEYVNSLIERHRFNAITKVNIEVLLTSWEVGEYISIQLKTSRWGSKVVSELADYLKLQNPQRRGFGKRHLYNMVKFYDLYSRVEFSEMIKILHLSEIVQSSIAQLGYIEKVDQVPLKSSITLLAIPELLLLIPFTSHLEIMNRCNTDEERIFYMIYASQQSLKTEELRRCIVNQTYASLMNKDNIVEYTLSRSLSPTMVAEYRRKLIPIDVMRKSLEEYCEFLNNR